MSTPDFRFILGGGMDSGEYKKIYHNEAQRYEALVSREDYQGNILPALLEINELDGRVIVEPGAGTGRLTKLLAPRVSFVYGFDISPAMLAVAREELARTEARNWALAVADHAHLPLPPNSADVIISGWSLCYLALDQPEPWREPLRAVFSRFEEILRPGGTIIILETMGTGHTTPNPPDFMGDYFGFLEELGFSSTWIRTDYRFESPEEAQALSRFFFGDELGDQVARSRSAVLPECTGIWWK